MRSGYRRAHEGFRKEFKRLLGEIFTAGGSSTIPIYEMRELKILEKYKAERELQEGRLKGHNVSPPEGTAT